MYLKKEFTTTRTIQYLSKNSTISNYRADLEINKQ